MIRAYLARRTGDAGETAKTEARLAKIGDVLARALDGNIYLVGDRFTIADVVVGGVLDSAREYELLPASDRLLAYLELLDGREAKQRAYADA
jgi:glutathione S-transferase